MWDDVIQCNSCPGASFTDRAVYASHVKTKWHLYNTNCRMMGNPTLTHDAYVEKFGGDPNEAGSVSKDLTSNPTSTQKPTEVNVEETAKKEEEEDMATVVVMFTYREEKWSHKFSVKKGTTVLDFKKVMLKPGSPDDDLLSFSLKHGMIRVWNFETIDSDETFEFQYIEPEEGQKFLDRDLQRKQRDDDEARAREEEEQRKLEEKKRQEEERKRQAEEAELEEKRKQDEEARMKHEEEERRKREEEARRQQEEEEERRQQEEIRKREEEARRQQEEEERRQQEEEKRRQQEEEEKQKREEEEREQRSQEPIEVTVHIDRAMDFKMTLSLKRGAKVSEIKESLASDDPTGQLRPQDLCLLDASGRELGDDEQVMSQTEMDLKNVSA